MIWWVYQQALKASSLDDLIVATDDQRIAEACKKYGMKYIMTSLDHDSPTSRMYEVATKMRYDYYVFIGGDEPLIEPCFCKISPRFIPTAKTFEKIALFPRFFRRKKMLQIG